MVRVDCNEIAALQALPGQVACEPAAELVTWNEGLPDRRSADASVLVVMEVAAAESDSCDLEQDLARLPFPKIEGGYSHVVLSIKIQGTGHGIGPLCYKCIVNITFAMVKKAARDRDGGVT
jgi:hypothetical protein